LMYFLSKMEDNNPSSEAVLQALDLAFALLKDAELPIAEYTSLWQAVFALSVVFAESRQIIDLRCMLVNIYTIK